MYIRTLALTSALIAPLACTDNDAISDLGEEDAVTPRLGLDSGCSRWRCGYNAAEINGDSLRELHLGGQANADGVTVVGFLSPLNLLGYKLSVEDDRFVARGGLLLGTLQGAALIGSTILIKLGSGLVVPVVIAGIEEVPSWAAGGPPITAYSLVYADLDDPLAQRNVCTGTLLDPLTAAVTLIGGETYDEATKTVNPGMNGWVTLACAGSAAAKLKLLGYGPGGDVDGQGTPATVLQRQATLKMITADYCGDGQSYTKNGTPLLWANAGGTVAPEPGVTVGAFEAAWSSGGALCLDTPRDPDLAASLHCALPACAAAHSQAGEWVTMNPGDD